MSIVGKQVTVTDTPTALESDDPSTALAGSTVRVKNRDSSDSVYLGGPGVTGPGVNEEQEVTIGTNSAGQFKLTFDGQQTVDIAFDADAATVQAALEGLSNIAPGDVAVAGVSSPWTVAFQGSLAAEDVAEMTLQDGTTPLSGGSGEGVTTNTEGYPGPANPVNPGFELKPADDPLTVELESGAQLYGCCAQGDTVRVDVLEAGD